MEFDREMYKIDASALGVRETLPVDEQPFVGFLLPLLNLIVLHYGFQEFVVFILVVGPDERRLGHVLGEEHFAEVEEDFVLVAALSLVVGFIGLVCEEY